MKEIKMPYKEYEEMVALIKLQQECINEFKKQPNVVLVDSRHDLGRFFNSIAYIGSIPKVTGDPDKAREMMKDEFNSLYKQIKELERDFMIANAKPKEVIKPKKSWWEF